jgi:hypothetical protein
MLVKCWTSRLPPSMSPDTPSQVYKWRVLRDMTSTFKTASFNIQTTKHAGKKSQKNVVLFFPVPIHTSKPARGIRWGGATEVLFTKVCHAFCSSPRTNGQLQNIFKINRHARCQDLHGSQTLKYLDGEKLAHHILKAPHVQDKIKVR